MFYLLIIIFIFIIFIIIYLLLNNKFKTITPEGIDHNYEKCKLSNDYNIKIIPNFINDSDCEYFINIAKDKLIKSKIFSNENTDNQVSDNRTSSQVWLDSNDPIGYKLKEKVSQLTNLPIENQEQIQILKYNPGEHYLPHYDAHIEDSESSKQDKLRGGFRLSTVLIYLNTVKNGDHTVFPNLNMKINPEKRKAVYFQNLNKERTDRHPCSLHWAQKPLDNEEKWAMNIWVRESKFI